MQPKKEEEEMLQIEPFLMFPSRHQVFVVGLTVVLVFTGSSLAVHVGQDPVNEVKRAEQKSPSTLSKNINI